MKKKLSLSFFLVVFSALSSFAQLDLFDEAYAFYPLGNDVLDYSGNNFHFSSSNVSTVDGYYANPNGSSLFNGVNSMITRPALDLEDTIAIAGWYFSTNSLQNCNLFYNGNSGSNGYGVFLKKPFTTYGLGSKIVVVQGGISENVLDTSYSMPLNQWTHVALVVRNTYFELYINGLLRGSGIRPFNQPQGEFSVGMNSQQLNGGFPSFFGRIDDVVVYKRNTDANWIYRLYTEGLTTRTNKFEIPQNEISVTTQTGGIMNINASLDISEFKIIDITGKVIPAKIEKTDQVGGYNNYRVTPTQLLSGLVTLQAYGHNQFFTKKLVLNGK